jgi:sugar phosphate isomerase/epimerase
MHMASRTTDDSRPGRRDFLKTASGGLTAAGLLLSPREAAAAQALSEKARLDRIASNSYPLRFLFKSRAGGRGGGRGGGSAAAQGMGSQTPGGRSQGPGASTQAQQAAASPTPAGGRAGGQPVPGRGMGGVTPEEMKKKYGEITLLEFPQFTKDTFPGVVHMDVWSSLFGDVTDETMFAGRGFDPSTPSARKWLERLASNLVRTGTRIHHISNNAPTGMAGPDEEARRAGLEVAKKWLDAAKILGAKSMRVNSGGPSILPSSERGPDGYPKNDAIVPFLKTCIESFKEMADVGAERDVKVTLENHWGLTCNPVNMRIILDAVNHPYCEASPDYANWEHEYMLFSGLKDIAPYAHTTVHAKFWDRWTTNDVQRSTRIMLASGYQGKFALEYESGPWDGVEGVRYLFKEVMAALSAPHL